MHRERLASGARNFLSPLQFCGSCVKIQPCTSQEKETRDIMARRWFQVFRLLTGLALFATLLGGCESATPHPGNNIATPGVIKIGAELPLAGDDASAGKAAEDGIRLAIDEANRQH